MTSIALTLLSIQIVLGALDNVWHHELKERLPSKPSASRELSFHAARETIYAILFLTFAWTDPKGVFALAIVGLLAAEIVITIFDFVEEDRSRTLPPFERVLHTILAITYGGFLFCILPWLLNAAASPTQVDYINLGLMSWFLTASSLGVAAFAIRNTLAVMNFSEAPPQSSRTDSSGRSILVTGATGFVGTVLIKRLLIRGDRVIVLTRDKRQARGSLGASVLIFEHLAEIPEDCHVDAVVNLAGAPVIGLPWFNFRRREMLNSRVELTRNLVKWMQGRAAPPRVLVNASAIGFYGDRRDQIISENCPKGEGFAADLCEAWEQEAQKAQSAGIRTVTLRIGLVLDSTGGALPMMALPIRFYAGAVLGSGQQWMSWIQRSDLCRMIVTAVDNAKWTGVINAVAPEPATQRNFQSALARTLQRPLLFRIPAWCLKLMLGEMATIFTYSQRVIPKAAQENGFAFDVHWAQDAIDCLLSTSQSMPLATAVPLPDRNRISETDLKQSKKLGETSDDHSARRPAIALRTQSKSSARGEAA